MMFSSNQELKISGELDKESVIAAVSAALIFSGEMEKTYNTKRKLYYQISKGGHYCIGAYTEDPENPLEGWEKFSFDASVYGISQYALEMIALHIIEYLNNQDYTEVLKEYSGGGGGLEKGFLMEPVLYCSEYSMPEKERIKNPWRGIVSFEPFACYYAK